MIIIIEVLLKKCHTILQTNVKSTSSCCTKKTDIYENKKCGMIANVYYSKHVCILY